MCKFESFGLIENKQNNTQGTMMKKNMIKRREFLKSTAAAGVGLILPSGVLSGANAASNKLNVALIGADGRARAHYRGLKAENVVALCDVDEEHLAFAAKEFPGAKHYADWRTCLEQKNLDAVVCCTPDHSHAMIALAVIAKGKHLYCEKPLCRTVYETRVVTEAARKAGVATQLGNFGHSSEDIRLSCEWIWDGAIGDVHDVHSWTTTGARRWTSLTDRPQETPPVPAGFDWQRWLEPFR